MPKRQSLARRRRRRGAQHPDRAGADVLRQLEPYARRVERELAATT